MDGIVPSTYSQCQVQYVHTFINQLSQYSSYNKHLITSHSVPIILTFKTESIFEGQLTSFKENKTQYQPATF